MKQTLAEKIERQYRSQMAWYAHTAHTHHRACAARETDPTRAAYHEAQAAEFLQEYQQWTGQQLDAAAPRSATSAVRQPSQHSTQQA